MTGSLRNTIAVGIAGLLSAVPLMQLTADARFLVGVLVVVLLLQGAAALVRRVTTHPWLPLLAQSALLVLGLTLAAATHRSPWHQLWSWRPVGLVFEEALAQMAEQSAPMDANDAVLLVLVAAVGVVTILIDLAFITARSALLAALPLLGGYTVATVVLVDPVRIGSLVAVCVGWLALLASRTVDHEQRWPRGLDRGPGTRLDLRGFSSLAVGLGVFAIATALLAGLAIPNTPQKLWPDRGGTGTVYLTDPNIELNENLRRPEDRQVVSYTTTAPGGVMLRSSALTRVDADGWHQIDMALQYGFPARVPGVAGVEPNVTTQVSVGDFASAYLPSPYAPVRWDAEGQWRFDPATLTVLNIDQRTGAQALVNLSYTVQSLDSSPTAEQVVNAVAGLPPDGKAALEVPPDMPQVIADLAREITAAADTDGRKAVALQDWLRDTERFSYTLDAPPGTGYSSLVNFLTRDFAGYCVHFSGSMALMARVLGIPSRVAVGFTTGTQQADGSWLLTSHNMHAWPELYFSGLGWVRFEPTVSAGGAPSWTELPGPVEETTPTAEPSPSPTTSPTTTTPKPDVPADEIDVPAQERPIGPGWPLGILGAVLVLVAPGLARIWLRRHRLGVTGSSGQVRGAWRELRATAIDLGLPWPEATPRQLAGQTWLGLDAEGRAALLRLAVLTERLHYSPGLPEQVEVAEDVALVSRQWRTGVSAWTRTWTRLVPRSLMMDVRWPGGV